jgi:hypothetical protein
VVEAKGFWKPAIARVVGNCDDAGNWENAMTKSSTMKAFAPGDIFLACTDLNDAEDDHKGEGRILQFDANMVPKGTLYTEGTSHLTVNCRICLPIRVARNTCARGLPA